MADEAKTHKLTLGKHTEHVSDKELAAIKAAHPRTFGEYVVTPLKVAKPADVSTPALAAPKPPKEKDADKAA